MSDEISNSRWLKCLIITLLQYLLVKIFTTEIHSPKRERRMRAPASAVGLVCVPKSLPCTYTITRGRYPPIKGVFSNTAGEEINEKILV